MSAKFQSIDDQIKASYQSACQVETQARQLEARISRIDGAKRHLPARLYDQHLDLAAIRSNLTLSSLIMQDSAELSHFLGLDPSYKNRIEEQKEVAKLRAESLKMQAEQLAARNAAARQQREQRQAMPSWAKGYRSFYAESSSPRTGLAVHHAFGHQTRYGSFVA